MEINPETGEVVAEINMPLVLRELADAGACRDMANLDLAEMQNKIDEMIRQHFPDYQAIQTAAKKAAEAYDEAYRKAREQAIEAYKDNHDRAKADTAGAIVITHPIRTTFWDPDKALTWAKANGVPIIVESADKKALEGLVGKVDIPQDVMVRERVPQAAVYPEKLSIWVTPNE